MGHKTSGISSNNGELGSDLLLLISLSTEGICNSQVILLRGGPKGAEDTFLHRRIAQKTHRYKI